MRKIFLSAGHTNNASRDRGAFGNNTWEGDETAILRSLIYDELKKLGANVFRDPDNTILGESIKNFKGLSSPEDILLDIHFNAGPPSAKGSETFVQTNPLYFEVKLAERLSATAARILETTTRGNKGVKLETESQHKNGLGWMRCPGMNVLNEVCFITNAMEMGRYQMKKPELAAAFASDLLEFSKVETNLPSKPVYREFTVQSGMTLSLIAQMYHTTVDALCKLNGINDPNHLSINQKIKIPN